MIKRVIIVLGILLITIAVLLGYQWLTYDLKAKNDVKVQKSALNIDLSIDHRNGKLQVVQKVSNFQQPHFFVTIPKNAQELKCSYGNEQDCTINQNKIKIDNEEAVSFSYYLPVNLKQQTAWFEDWFVRFLGNDKQALIANYYVMLTEEDKTITWIAGALNKAQVEKEHLSYFAWTKTNTTDFPLYMTKSNTKKVSQYEPKLSVYSSNSDSLPSIGDWIDQIPKQTGLTLVQSANGETHIAPLLLIVPNSLESDEINELLVKAYLLSSKQPKSQEIKWVWDVLPALILDRPVASGKQQEMATELLERLDQKTKTSLAKWLIETKEKKTIIDLPDLDKALSNAAQLKTEFFTKNKNRNEKAVPLYFYESRPIYHNNQWLNKDWNAIERNGSLHFPIVNMLQSLDFEVKVMPEDHSYFITKDGNSWRFYLNETYFIYNQDDYGLTQMPLEQLGDEVFISEKWMEELLRIEVIKRDDAIYLR